MAPRRPAGNGIARKHEWGWIIPNLARKWIRDGRDGSPAGQGMPVTAVITDNDSTAWAYSKPVTRRE